MADQNGYYMWCKQEMIAMWLILHVRSTSKMIKNFCNRSDRVSIVTKTEKDNNVTKHIDAVFIKNETKLSWPIEPSPISSEG